MSDVTRILDRVQQGDAKATEQLLPLVYEELRKLAATKMAQEKPGQTLQATALVHDAYIRLVDVEKAQHWDSRGHFFAAAAEAMRRILVDHARNSHRREHIEDFVPQACAVHSRGLEDLGEQPLRRNHHVVKLAVADDVVDAPAAPDERVAVLVSGANTGAVSL